MLQGENTDVGEPVTCIATATDPHEATGTSSAPVEVLNTPPMIHLVTLSSAAPRVGDDLTCGVEAEDADHEPLETHFEWSTGQTTATITLTAENTTVGEPLTCSVTVTDPHGASVEADEAVIVANSPPSVVEIDVAPPEARVGESVTCSALGSDPDEEPLDYHFEWSNGFVGSELTLTAENSTPGVPLLCTATVTDPHGATASDSASALTQGTPPGIDHVAISPPANIVGGELICSAEASDPDGGSVSLSYEWSTGQPGQTLVLQGSNTVVNEPVTCFVTATDDWGLTDTQTSQAIVLNSPPIVHSVSIAPNEAPVGEEIFCEVVASDPDEEPLTTTYAWSTGATTSSIVLTADDADVGEEVFCTATVSDPHGETDSGVGSATMLNSEPTITSLEILPSEARVDEMVECRAEAEDPDGDTLDYAYSWSNGESGPFLVLTAGNSTPHTEIACTVEVSDGNGGVDEETTHLAVLNTNPVIEQTQVTPSAAQVGEIVQCSASGFDPDGGGVAFEVVWSNGHTGATQTLQGSDTIPNQVVTCEVTATDDFGGVATGTAEVMVLNTPPQLLTVQVSPSVARVGQTLQCSATASDADEEPLSIHYSWSTGAVGSSLPVTADNSSVGSEITCQAMVEDPHGATDSRSDAAMIENTPPGAPEVRFSPSAPYAGQALTCEVTSPSFDADNHDVSYGFEWFVNDMPYFGAMTAEASSTVPGADVTTDQHWECIVTPWDGYDNGDPAYIEVVIDPPPCQNGALRYTDETCGSYGEAFWVEQCWDGEWEDHGCGSSRFHVTSSITASAGAYPPGVMSPRQTVFSARISSDFSMGFPFGPFSCSANPDVIGCTDLSWILDDSDYLFFGQFDYSENMPITEIMVTTGHEYCDGFFFTDCPTPCEGGPGGPGDPGDPGDPWDPGFPIINSSSTSICTRPDSTLSFHGFDGVVYTLSASHDLFLDTHLPIVLNQATLSSYDRTQYFSYFPLWSSIQTNFSGFIDVAWEPAECEATMEREAESSSCVNGMVNQVCQGGMWVDDGCI
ncbi:MAG: hypothetical protein EA397_17035 [Deltaproteobacteria bacterium]|nr:MAG: hypothetical protein EA397_17035 [Deltaproteobacteria bacterium]